ncbi:O-methylsterigmatocystin oxidoreductase [Aspergillus sclerotiicarbonarius CBS 121057]|uniref:O-methylsterigmatocystin oxidoreductase n=1 Tax=Aspergillus sclerotiicarbonarius (strain CBS 121057 / IBT 28362) TaxID=1448318 RepID=A0A319FFM5_ASPSB|nr:O-methylsterigmatocystin oxidoreductase [Aspergillus sclerotiicarbonarius CBS 121057]
MSLLVRAIVALAGLYLLKSFLNRNKFPAPLPPGPKPKPIIGNLRDLPSPDKPDWLHWYKHKELYGPISSIRVFGETLIILNDARLAVELLEKRSVIYSDRPSGHFTKMAGFGNVVTTQNNNDYRVRAQRKLFHQQIGSNASVARFNPIQEAEVGRFLVRVLDNPGDLRDHIRKEAGAIILKLAYGYTVEPHGSDPLVDLVNRAMASFTESILPGIWLVDFIPSLKHLPTWFPGATFARAAEAFQEDARAWGSQPYEFVRQQMSQNNYTPSYVSGLVEKNGFPEPGSREENVVKWSASAIYGGGSDTASPTRPTISTMGALFLAMALYPDMQRKAQEEIDRVVGTSRLPGYADRDNLPYINAMVKEALRWHSVLPMGVAHASMEDDMCEGYFIPKGSQILPNQWAFTHDPTVYPDPMAFKPERFLAYGDHVPERDPHLLAFGFGRRVCPGRTLADSNIYLSLVQSLAVFRITKPIKDGKEVDLRLELLPGLLSHVAPYEVDIKPRSPQHEALIRAVEAKYPWEEGHAEELSQVKW